MPDKNARYNANYGYEENGDLDYNNDFQQSTIKPKINENSQNNNLADAAADKLAQTQKEEAKRKEAEEKAKAEKIAKEQEAKERAEKIEAEKKRQQPLLEQLKRANNALTNNISEETINKALEACLANLNFKRDNNHGIGNAMYDLIQILETTLPKATHLKEKVDKILINRLLKTNHTNSGINSYHLKQLQSALKKFSEPTQFENSQQKQEEPLERRIYIPEPEPQLNPISHEVARVTNNSSSFFSQHRNTIQRVGYGTSSALLSAAVATAGFGQFHIAAGLALLSAITALVTYAITGRVVNNNEANDPSKEIYSVR